MKVAIVTGAPHCIGAGIAAGFRYHQLEEQ
jgi:hypothetical protein